MQTSCNGEESRARPLGQAARSSGTAQLSTHLILSYLDSSTCLVVFTPPCEFANADELAGCTVSALPKHERVDKAAGSSSGDANIGGGRRHATSTGMKRRFKRELAGEGEDPQPQP